MLRVLDNVEPTLVRLVAGLGNVIATLPEGFPNIYITHAWDGVHGEGSLHKMYAALDVRTHNLTDREADILLDMLQVKFPYPRFDVIHEDPGGPNQHFHIEDNSARRRSNPEVTHI